MSDKHPSGNPKLVKQHKEIQRKGDRAAYVDVVERRHLVIHRNESDGVVLRRRDHLQLAFGLQRLDIAGLQIDDEIGAKPV